MPIFSNQSHVIPKQIPPASAHAALLRICKQFFAWLFFIICTDPIMESEIISLKIVDYRCVSYGKYVPDPERLGAATTN